MLSPAFLGKFYTNFIDCAMFYNTAVAQILKLEESGDSEKGLSKCNDPKIAFRLRLLSQQNLYTFDVSRDGIHCTANGNGDHCIIFPLNKK